MRKMTHLESISTITPPVEAKFQTFSIEKTLGTCLNFNKHGDTEWISLS